MATSSGLYYVKNIREAMEWDKVLDTVKSRRGRRGRRRSALEMVTALAHRGIETHLVDPSPWAMSMATDPDIMAPVEDSWREMGVHLHFNTTLKAFLGDATAQCAASRPRTARSPADLVVVCHPQGAEQRAWRDAGRPQGRAHRRHHRRRADGDVGARTSTPPVTAPRSRTALTHVPLQGLTGSHAYAQGKVAGVNAAGGTRALPARSTCRGGWRPASGSSAASRSARRLATALGIPFVVGAAQGISRARYYPDVKPVTVKLLAEPGTLRLIGAQMVGGEGIKERADFLAMAVKFGITLHDLATMENVYSPADRRAERADRRSPPRTRCRRGAEQRRS